MPKLKSVSSDISAANIAAAGVARKNDIADLRKIDISYIVDTGNVREQYEDIEGLAESIEKHGLLQPISVKELISEDGFPRYELVAGFRRWKSFQFLNSQGKGFALIDAIVVSGEKLILQLVENLQRVDLTAKEREQGIALLEERGFKGIDIAKLLSKSTAYISKNIKAYYTRKNIEEAGVDTSKLETGTIYAIARAVDEGVGTVESIAWSVIIEGGIESSVKKVIDRYKLNFSPEDCAETQARSQVDRTLQTDPTAEVVVDETINEDIEAEITERKAHMDFLSHHINYDKNRNEIKEADQESIDLDKITVEAPKEQDVEDIKKSNTQKVHGLKRTIHKAVDFSQVSLVIMDYITQKEDDGTEESRICARVANDIIELLNKTFNFV
jgi:ParB/RepB/Spo0J family partition protein